MELQKLHSANGESVVCSDYSAGLGSEFELLPGCEAYLNDLGPVVLLFLVNPPCRIVVRMKWDRMACALSQEEGKLGYRCKK